MRYLILLTLLLSCQKEIMPECLIRQTGTIQFENVSGNAYVISVAGVTAPLGGGLVVSDVSAGQKQVKVDSSGNIRIIEVQVLPCDTSVVVL